MKLNSELINIWGTSRSGHNFIGQVIQSWLPYSRFKYLTNVLPEDLKNEGIVPGSITIYIRRRFDNFLASTLMAYGPDPLRNSSWPVGVGRKIKTYKAIENYSLTEEGYDHIDLVISYDRFVTSQGYRKGICQHLGGVYIEEMLGVVSTEGNGSSFDGLKLQGRGQEMKVTERSKQILETKWANIYNELLKEYYG